MFLIRISGSFRKQSCTKLSFFNVPIMRMEDQWRGKKAKCNLRMVSASSHWWSCQFIAELIDPVHFDTSSAHECFPISCHTWVTSLKDFSCAWLLDFSIDIFQCNWTDCRKRHNSSFNKAIYILDNFRLACWKTFWKFICKFFLFSVLRVSHLGSIVVPMN